jgi:hypothetical protein
MKISTTSDVASFLESLLFTLPEDELQELRDASIFDFSDAFTIGAQAFISGFREYLDTRHPDLADRADELERSFGGNVYFSLSGHGCGFWDDRNAKLGRAFDNALKAYSGNRYRFEDLGGMLSMGDDGKVDLAILPEYIAEYHAKLFTV